MDDGSGSGEDGLVTDEAGRSRVGGVETSGGNGAEGDSGMGGGGGGEDLGCEVNGRHCAIERDFGCLYIEKCGN